MITKMLSNFGIVLRCFDAFLFLNFCRKHILLLFVFFFLDVLSIGFRLSQIFFMYAILKQRPEMICSCIYAGVSNEIEEKINATEHHHSILMRDQVVGNVLLQIFFLFSCDFSTASNYIHRIKFYDLFRFLF